MTRLKINNLLMRVISQQLENYESSITFQEGPMLIYLSQALQMFIAFAGSPLQGIYPKEIFRCRYSL